MERTSRSSGGVIEATKESDFFGFYSPELGGFTGLAILLKIVSIKPGGTGTYYAILKAAGIRK
jgi:hypothetical protein